MSDWVGRKFWQEARITELPIGFGIQLDGKFAMTPGKKPLVVPYLPLAEKICEEFQTQEKKIDPSTMPFTRRTNTTIDRIPDTRNEMIDSLVNYGHTDLVCYQASSPLVLVKWQSEHWNPVLTWLAEELSIEIKTGQGIIPFEQNAHTIGKFSEEINSFDNYLLCGFSELVPLLGSLILSFAYLYGFGSKERIWRLSRIDEEWQEKKWGVDTEAQRVAENHHKDFLVACFFVDIALDNK